MKQLKCKKYILFNIFQNITNNLEDKIIFIDSCNSVNYERVFCFKSLNILKLGSIRKFVYVRKRDENANLYHV